jgi:outer membrane protein assembly factor BamA
MEYILGGGNTIRGWSFGSRNGKNQFINTAEYRYTLVKPRSVSVSSFHVHVGLQLAVYGDFGQAWSEADEFRWEDFIGGYGFGLRILVPFVNMIRMDFAWGEPGKGMSFYIAIWEKAVMQRFRVR